MLGKPLSIVANVPMDPEGAAGSMLFHELSRNEASPHDNSSSLLSIALTFLIYKAVRRYRRHVAEGKSTPLMMKNKVKQYKHEVE